MPLWCASKRASFSLRSKVSRRGSSRLAGSTRLSNGAGSCRTALPRSAALWRVSEHPALVSHSSVSH